MGLIYETNVRPKIGRTVVSTQNLEFINMDVSGGYDQISRQVWASCTQVFWVSLNLRAAVIIQFSEMNFRELYNDSILFI